MTLKLRIFSGLCLWKKPTEDEMTIGGDMAGNQDCKCSSCIALTGIENPEEMVAAFKELLSANNEMKLAKILYSPWTMAKARERRDEAMKRAEKALNPTGGENV